jgi:peptidyl-prolyl cis-trans isomerase A (cyclophilin A)
VPIHPLRTGATRRSAAILAAAILALSGCGPDEALVAERDQLRADLEASRLSVERVERDRDALSARVERLDGELLSQKKREILRRLELSEGDALVATLDTSAGVITCDLAPADAPIAVLNFVELAEGSRAWTDPRTGQEVTRPLYDGTIFHRVIPGFMIQGGDPLGRGTGGPGYRFEDEDSGLRFDTPGLLAMANSGPDTNGSQFFITAGTPAHLNGKHTIFGSGCAPLDRVRAIAGVERDARDKPLVDVVLHRVTVTRGS